jgi:hypothetical protein
MGVAAADREEGMTPLERLKTLTRPMNRQELEAFLMKHYGALSRENVSADETALLPEDLAHLEQEQVRSSQN